MGEKQNMKLGGRGIWEKLGERANIVKYIEHMYKILEE